MKIKNITGILFLCFLFSFFTVSFVEAGYIPGTINTSTSSGFGTCGTKGHEYDPYNGSCKNVSCKTYNTQTSETVCGCESYVQSCTGTGASEICTDTATCDVAKSCADPAFGCQIYNTTATTGKQNFYDKISTKDYSEIQDILGDGKGNEVSRIMAKGCSVGKDQYDQYDFSKITCGGTGGGNYNPPAGKVSLDQGKRCNVSCKGTTHTPPIFDGLVTCSLDSAGYYTGGKDGICTCSSYNNTINSFTQNGGVVPAGSSTPGSSCVVEGRYATPDNTGPIISITNYGTFSDDDTQWCNLNKYKGLAPFTGTYGSNTNINTPGCDFYNVNNGQDLVDNIEITVEDVSGISKIKVELGQCAAEYDFTSLPLNELIAHQTSPTGIHSEYKKLTINTSNNTIYGKSGIISLKGLFGKTGINDKLDDCLVEGENYINVTAYDAARSTVSVTGLDTNSTNLLNKDYSIRIDNSGPVFNIVSDYKFDPNYKKYSTSIFDSSFDKDTWYNETISGEFIMQDVIKSGETLCTNYVQSGIGTCPVINNVVWKYPVTASGTYAIYSCDDIAITDSSVCNFTCDTGYMKNATNDGCILNPKKYEWIRVEDNSCNAGIKAVMYNCVEEGQNSNVDVINCGSQPTFPTDETYITTTVDQFTVYASKTCIMPPACFTIGSSTLGGTEALCSN